MSARPSTKSQADDLEIVTKAGWKEDSGTRLEWRWFNPKEKPRIYRTLRDAAENIRNHSRNTKLAISMTTIIAMGNSRPSNAKRRK